MPQVGTGSIEEELLTLLAWNNQGKLSTGVSNMCAVVPPIHGEHIPRPTVDA